MKNDEQNRSTDQIRSGRSISAGFYSNMIRNFGNVYSNPGRIVVAVTPIALPFSGGSRLQTQNLAKAPPGRARDPGGARGHPPEGWTGRPELPEKDIGLPEKEKIRKGIPFGQTLLQHEKERMNINNNNNKNSNYYKHLTFKIMKKQILFLAFFVLAALAGTNVFGQVINYQSVPTAAPVCLTPQPFTSGVCTSNELHPVQGTPYTYTLNTTTKATDVVRWFVVNNNDLKTAGDSLISSLVGILPVGNTHIDPADGTGAYILNLGTPGTYNSGAAGNTSIQISWKYFDGKLPNEVLLVAYVEDGTNCTNNIAVYRIIPQPAFTIDVASVKEDGSNPAGPGETPNSECVSKIASALYTGADNTTPNGTLTVNYGENWVFFVVNGANYIDSWMPQFQLSYNGGAAPVAEASWAYIGDATSKLAANWHPLTGSGALAAAPTTWTSASAVVAKASAASPGTVGAGVVPAANGECIVVRVRLEWGTTIEHDGGDGTLTFAADGTAYDGVGPNFFDDPLFGDLDNKTCATDGFANDKVDYIITPRPEVEAGTPVQETKTGDDNN